MDTTTLVKKRKVDLNKALGKRLALLRKKQGKKQTDISSALKTRPCSVSKIEHGRRALDASELVDYARALDMHPMELCAHGVNVLIEYDGRAKESPSKPSSDRSSGTLPSHSQ